MTHPRAAFVLLALALLASPGEPQSQVELDRRTGWERNAENSFHNLESNAQGFQDYAKWQMKATQDLADQTAKDLAKEKEKNKELSDFISELRKIYQIVKWAFAGFLLSIWPILKWVWPRIFPKWRAEKLAEIKQQWRDICGTPDAVRKLHDCLGETRQTMSEHLAAVRGSALESAEWRIDTTGKLNRMGDSLQEVKSRVEVIERDRLAALEIRHRLVDAAGKADNVAAVTVDTNATVHRIEGKV